MAALAEAHRLELVELRHVDARRLEDLLREESAAWDRRLHWDFGPSASQISHHAAMRALDGLALVAGDEVAGYAYWVHEGRKALIGDLYVRDQWRSSETESLLLRGAMQALRELPDYSSTLSLTAPLLQMAPRRQPWINRIEAQLLQTASPAAQLISNDPGLEIYPRLFMLTSLDHAALEAPYDAPAGVRFERWSMRWIDEAAALIASVYRGHIDSEINDQYRSIEGARRFMQNIVQYPGCGVFQPDSSWIVFAPSGEAVALLLATRLSSASGHIAQICVEPDWQGSGTGREMMRRTLAGLCRAGMREASLTVTERNTRAIAMYRRFQFRTIHRFDAMVWNNGTR